MLHIVPSRAFFRPGDALTLSVSADEPLHGELQVAITHLGEPVATWTTSIQGTSATLTGPILPEARRGYLVQVQSDEHCAYTAFDVLECWTDAPRYGFLVDFSGNRSADDIRATFDYLLAMHVNGLQFYDWQYRHDTLLPPHSDFIDPLGQAHSLTTVQRLIAAAHDLNMAAMPYTATYAASPAFAAAHPDWQLYDEHGTPIDFADGFLNIMNPCSSWQAHFVKECVRVLEVLPFDGIHVDQYGEPKSGYAASGAVVNIAEGIANTLATLRLGIGSDRSLLFNLVHNWPVETIANSPLDCWYSELWPPETDFRRLWQTIRDNRRLNGRPAILAIYIPPEWEQTIIVAQCTILASGGTQIAHGDHGRYLSDAYFPKACVPSPALVERLRQLADFAVAYEEALTFAQDVTEAWIEHIQINGDPVVPGHVIVRASGTRLFVNILNNVGQWDADLPVPQPLTGLRITVNSSHNELKRAWTASPASPVPQPLPGSDLPPIPDWLLVCFEYADVISCPV